MMSSGCNDGQRLDEVVEVSGVVKVFRVCVDVVKKMKRCDGLGGRVGL